MELGVWFGLFCSVLGVASSTVTVPAEMVATSTEADESVEPLQLDELPLSDEDLALLAALDTHTTTTSTRAAPRWWLAPAPLPRPTVLFPRVRVRETIGRSAAEVFDAYPTVVDVARRYVPGDSAIIRGQSGHRVALSIEGVPLRHALSRSRETAGWLTIDPWVLEHAVVERPGVLSAAPEGTAGAISFSAVLPPERPGFEAEAEASARSADRSTSSHLSLGVAGEAIALRLAGGYGDHRPLRISTSKTGTEYGSGYQRVAAVARARFFGRPGDVVRGYAGVDFDRVLNIERTDHASNNASAMDPIIDRSIDRLLTFGRIELGDDELGASLLASRQSFGRTFGERSGGTGGTDFEGVDSYFLRGSVRARLIPNLIASAGGLAHVSDAELERSNGTQVALGGTRTFEGFVSVDFDAEWLSAYAVAAVVKSSTEIDSNIGSSGSGVDETRPLTQGGARLSIIGPLGLRAGWAQGLYVPGVRDHQDATSPLRAERSLTFDAGPSFYSKSGFVELLGFFTMIEDAIEPVSLELPRLINISEVEVIGLELTGGMFLTDQIRVAGVLTWSEGRDGASGAPVITFPTLTGRASVRYDFDARNAFLEAHVRGTTKPIYVSASRGADPPASLAGLAPASFARVGIAGGVNLAEDLRLEMSLENVVDTPYRTPTSLVPGTGVDVRAAISYAWR